MEYFQCYYDIHRDDTKTWMIAVTDLHIFIHIYTQTQYMKQHDNYYDHSMISYSLQHCMICVSAKCSMPIYI